MTVHNMSTGLAHRTFLALFFLISLMILAGGYGYYRVETKRIRQEKYQSITAIGELKAGQIQQWREHYLAEARRSAESPFF